MLIRQLPLVARQRKDMYCTFASALAIFDLRHNDNKHHSTKIIVQIWNFLLPALLAATAVEAKLPKDFGASNRFSVNLHRYDPRIARTLSANEKTNLVKELLSVKNNASTGPMNRRRPASTTNGSRSSATRLLWPWTTLCSRTIRTLRTEQDTARFVSERMKLAKDHQTRI